MAEGKFKRLFGEIFLESFMSCSVGPTHIRILHECMVVKMFHISVLCRYLRLGF